MKSLVKLKKQLSDNMERQAELKKLAKSTRDNSEYKKTTKELTRIKEEFKLLKLCVDYISTEPAESFLKSEQLRLSNRINAISDGFKSTIEDFGYREDDSVDKKVYEKALNAARKKYEKTMDIQKTRAQLRVINFLL